MEDSKKNLDDVYITNVDSASREGTVQDFNERSHQEYDPDSGVRRGLKTRHLSMMALAGIIGPGLLVGSGSALASGGPLALIIGFGVIGLLAFSVTQSLGEMTTLYPTGGAFMVCIIIYAWYGLGVAAMPCLVAKSSLRFAWLKTPIIY